MIKLNLILFRRFDFITKGVRTMKTDTLRQAIIYYFVVIIISALMIYLLLLNFEIVILYSCVFTVIYWLIYAFDVYRKRN